MKKNLAILIPDLSNGGAERVASNLSIYLDENKYNKYIVVYDSNDQDYSYGGNLIDLNAKAINNPLGKIFNLFKRVIKMRKFKKKYNINTTISLLSGPSLVNLLSKRDDKIIVSVRNFISKSSTGFYGNIFKILIKFLYNKADKVVPVSKSIAEDLIDNYNIDKSRINIINNPYDIDKITKMSKEKIEDEYKYIFNKPTLINMGRLTFQKGQWHLIRAFKKVKDEIEGAQLVILGKGELEEYLKDLTKKLNLSDSIHFLGFQNNPFKYIANSDLYVFPSLFEGFPNALVEAMACKIPVISSDCKSGPREILSPNSGLSTEIKDVEYGEFGILVPVCSGDFNHQNSSLSNEENILSETISKILKNKSKLKKFSNSSWVRVNDFKIRKIIECWDKII